MDDIAIGLIITFLFVCIAILFCAILIKVYVAKIKKYNRLLFEKELEREKVVSQAVMETQDQTLNDLAMELHDDTGQQLTMLHLEVERLKLEQPTQQKALQPLTKGLKELAQDLRQLSHSLTSNSLRDASLPEIIERELQRINRLGGVVCRLTVGKEPWAEITFNEKIIHYRIFQEVVNNMLKHAGAKTFTARLSKDSQGNAAFVYEDDGRGINHAAIQGTSGMRNLEQRAALIDYSIKFSNTRPTGTIIKLVKIQPAHD